MRRSALVLALLSAAPAWADHKDGTPGRLPRWSRQIRVSIDFYGQSGRTRTDADGITYMRLNGQVIGHENKVYPIKYWGIFPLYFFGQKVGVDIGVVNRSNRTFNLCVETEAHSINHADGSSGGTLLRVGDNRNGAPQEVRMVDIQVKGRRTAFVDGSFIGFNNPRVTSGLDRFTVTLSEGKCSNPGRVLRVLEGVLCPPEMYEALEEFTDFLP